MSKKANPTLIGGFVLGAIALTIGCIAVFGSGKFFEPRIEFGVFFDGSVSGLTVGSPVTFRGVKIGEVTDMEAIFDIDSEDIKIQTKFFIEPERIGNTRSVNEVADEGRYGGAMYLIRRGLRAQLSTFSVVTGQLYIDLDFYPQTPIVLIGLDEETREFPAVPSAMQEIEARAREALDTIGQLPFDEIFESVRSAAAGLDELVNSPDLRDAIAAGKDLLVNSNIPALLEELNATVVVIREALVSDDPDTPGLSQRVGDAADEARSTLAKLEETLGAADRAIESAGQMLDADGDLSYRLGTALDEVARAARSMRAFTDYLETHPEALISGKRSPD